MPILVFGFGLGIALLGLHSLTQALLWASIAGGLIVAACCLLRQSWRHAVMWLLAMIIGFCWAHWQVAGYYRWRLSPQQVGSNIMVVGKVESISQQNLQQSEFILRTTEVDHQRQQLRLRLSWYRHDHPRLLLGTTWRLVVRLKPPHGLRNPGGFDYQQWLWLQGIQATGYVVTAGDNYLCSANQHGIWPRWRQYIQATIETTVTDQQIAALLSALTVGLRDGFTNPMWQVLQQTGTNHLVVIAGLHLGLLVTTFFTVFRYAFSCWPRLLLYCPASRMAALAALAIAWIYALLAGFSVPTQRALWMLTAVLFGQLCYRTTSTIRRFMLAAGIVLLLDPLALFTASFWLSFGACAWIVYGMLGVQHRQPHWRQWVRAQWIVALGLMPLTLYFFQQLALAMMLANIIAIPWVGFVIVPLGFVASLLCLCHVSCSKLLFYWLAKLLAPLWHFLQWLASYPQLQWHQPIIQGWIVLTSSVAVLLLLAPRGVPGRWLGFLWLMPLCFYRLPTPATGELWITLLDVGQGLAIVAQTQHHTLVYDTGPRQVGGFDAGRDVVMPFLRRQHVSRVDIMIVSHGDNDHSGGAQSILHAMPVSQLVTSIPQLFPQQQAQACYAGQQWHWDGWRLQVLSPPQGMPYEDNNSSCVLRMSHGKQNVLLTGDIEAATEAVLLKQNLHQLPAGVLVVPHHGSQTSSSQPFVTAVHPRYALFSLGYYNRYHFPSAAVVARYRAIGAHLLFTATAGAISLHLSPPQSIQVQTMNKISYN